MSDTPEDLDALFDEMSAQSNAAVKSGVVHAEEPVSVETAVEKGTLNAIKPQFDSPEERLAMFDSLGYIVRQLHDSLRELGYDRSLSDISSEVTNAASRL